MKGVHAQDPDNLQACLPPNNYRHIFNVTVLIQHITTHSDLLSFCSQVRQNVQVLVQFHFYFLWFLHTLK